MSYLRLIRISNVIVGGFSTVAGYFLTFGVDWAGAILPATVVAFTLAGGNALNDFFDIATDRICHPTRPLACGKMKPTTAIFLTILFWVFAIVIASSISLFHSIIAVISQILLFLYCYFLSGVPLAGNLIIALLGSMAVLYGVLPEPSILTIGASAIAGILHFTREVFKDIDDIKGDIAVGRKTLPIVVQSSTVRNFARAMSIISAVFMLSISWFLSYGLPFRIGAGITATIAVSSAFFNRSASLILKSAMITGILSMFAEVFLR